MTLDIGSGERPRGEINLDVVRTCYCDIVADGQTLPFRERTFSKVMCSQVIEHVANPIRLLAEIHRVLREGGKLEIDFPLPWAANNWIKRLVTFIVNLPLSLRPAHLRLLFRHLRSPSSPRWLHRNIVTPQLISSVFHVQRIEKGEPVFLSVMIGKFKRFGRLNSSCYITATRSDKQLGFQHDKSAKEV